MESQPGLNGGTLVFVTGRLSIDGNNPLQFAQFFQIVQSAGGFNLLNDMMRLIYG